jgi:hypothetical protein
MHSWEKMEQNLQLCLYRKSWTFRERRRRSVGTDTPVHIPCINFEIHLHQIRSNSGMMPRGPCETLSSPAIAGEGMPLHALCAKPFGYIREQRMEARGLFLRASQPSIARLLLDGADFSGEPHLLSIPNNQAGQWRAPIPTQSKTPSGKTSPVCGNDVCEIAFVESQWLDFLEVRTRRKANLSKR